MKNDVLNSWNENADEWIKTLEEKRITSRKVTNTAIVSTISKLVVGKILDCGCGEGWLTRKMTDIGIKSVGVDATAKLIKNARTKGPEAYYAMSYEEISKGKSIPESPFDAAVFNFSLYQKDGLKILFTSIKKAISKSGLIIIQTLHPYFLEQQGLTFKSQWLENSWMGLSGDFKNGHQWYARTITDWQLVFTESDLILKEQIVTKDSMNVPLSVIFVLSLKS